MVSFKLPHFKLTMSKSNFFSGQPVFSQLVGFIPKTMVGKASRQFNADRYCKKFDTYHHLITMLYSCYQSCSSLREIVTGMQASEGRLQSLGIKYFPARSTLSEANQRRSYEVFEQIYYGLFTRYAHLLADSRKQRATGKLIIVDSTTISLFQEILKNAGRPGMNGKKKGGIKVHMAVNARQDVPYLVRLTAASRADAPFMNEIKAPKGSIIVMDKAYNNFHMLNQWQKQGVDWVTRLKQNTVYTVISSLELTHNEEQSGVISDELIIMGFKNSTIEQVECRLVTFFDNAKNQFFQFITSNKRMSALKIAGIYKQRWQIEMIFKRLKQNMPLEYFLGDNENAIKVQIFCTLIADLLLKVITSNLKRKWAFTTLASFVRLHLLTYINIFHFLENPERSRIYYEQPRQMALQLSG